MRAALRPNWQALTSRITDTRRRMLRRGGVAAGDGSAVCSCWSSSAGFCWRSGGIILPLSILNEPRSPPSGRETRKGFARTLAEPGGQDPLREGELIPGAAGPRVSGLAPWPSHALDRGSEEQCGPDGEQEIAEVAGACASR